MKKFHPANLVVIPLVGLLAIMCGFLVKSCHDEAPSAVVTATPVVAPPLNPLFDVTINPDGLPDPGPTPLTVITVRGGKLNIQVEPMPPAVVDDTDGVVISNSHDIPICTIDKFGRVEYDHTDAEGAARYFWKWFHTTTPDQNVVFQLIDGDVTLDSYHHTIQYRGFVVQTDETRKLWHALLDARPK